MCAVRNGSEGIEKRKGKEILFTVLLKHLYRHKEFFCSVKHSKYTAVLQNNFSFNILRINRKKQKQPNQTHTKNLKSFLENIRVQHDLSYFNFLSCTTEKRHWEPIYFLPQIRTQ